MIRCSKLYKATFVEYDYLLCSEAFVKADYYVIQGHEDNYKHLTGVETQIDAATFFEKCFNGTLDEKDFSFQKWHKSEKEVKGAVRDKLKVLPDIVNLFTEDMMVEEDFCQNIVRCSFAAEMASLTLGFICDGFSKPMTLLRGKKLKDRAGAIELVLRKCRGEEKYNKMLVGNKDTLIKYGNKISSFLSDELVYLITSQNIA